MKTAYKFILKSYLGPMILTFFIVMFVLVLQFMWRYIDELVGKGLGLDVIAELLVYASLSVMPMGLPLATLLAAIMTLGNMGENYELLALKSAGVSLPRILKPLIILIFFISVGSYFIADKVVPYSYKKMFTLIFDIRQQQHNMEFKDGIFFNGFPNLSIRVAKQDDRTKLLNDVLIYDTRDPSGNMTTTLADSGYINMSEDKKYILVTLYNGETFQESRNIRWFDNSTLTHNIFEVQNMVIPIEGYDFERSNDEIFSSNSQTKTTKELTLGIDSLQREVDRTTQASFDPLIKSYLFPKDTLFVSQTDSAKLLRSQRTPFSVIDSIPQLDLARKKALYDMAMNNARSSQNYYSWDENASKSALNDLYKYKVEWHRKLSLPVSIMIFFLIGAPLGAIIRKGGLGTPIVVSVSFFVIYYIITITGEKMAKEGTVSSFAGMWVATFILLPIAIYLVYKATNDSNLLNSEWYITKFKKLKNFFKTKIWRKTEVS